MIQINIVISILIIIILIIIIILLNTKNTFKNINNTIDLYIVGTGGAGNTELLKSLSKVLKTNDIDDNDQIKHLSRPEKLNFIPKKVLYIYGEPTKSIYSHYRRWNSPNEHYKKLNNDTNNNYIHSNEYSTYVYDVTNRLEDLSGIYEHYKAWKGYDKSPIYFLDFSKFKDKKEELMKFLDIKELDIDFDEKRYNKYNSEKENVENDIYKNFYKNIYLNMK